MYAVKRYKEDDAAVNGFPFDRHQEMLAVRAFTDAVRFAADEYLRDPLGIPLISNWNRVTSAIARICQDAEASRRSGTATGSDPTDEYKKISKIVAAIILPLTEKREQSSEGQQ